MRRTGIRAMVCAAVLALAAASNASANWPYGWGGWYGGYWPTYGYGYWGNAYSYYPTGYFSYYPSYYSYYYPSYYPSYSYPVYYSTPTYVSPQAVVSTPSLSTYRSFYPPDTAPARNEADVRVVTAPDAQLWFNGVLTNQTGSVRTFSTPELQPGAAYSYDVKIRWMENGSPMERTRKVAVSPGETVELDLTPAALMR
jgi:uncharacterized protein (TIGR03000 family)